VFNLYICPLKLINVNVVVAFSSEIEKSGLRLE